MKKANENLRLLMSLWGVTMWQLAEKIGVHETTVVRWFRVELTGDRKQTIETALNALRAEQMQQAAKQLDEMKGEDE